MTSRFLALPMLAALTLAAPVAAQPPDLDPAIVKLLSESPRSAWATSSGASRRSRRATPCRHRTSPRGNRGRPRSGFTTRCAATVPPASDFDTYEIPAQGERIVRDTRLRNVMAVLPGKSPRRIYVSGHYDSLARAPRPSEQGTTAAPGAAPQHLQQERLRRHPSGPIRVGWLRLGRRRFTPRPAPTTMGVAPR